MRGALRTNACWWLTVVATGLAGCLGTPAVEMSAADSLDAIATETQRALGEYAADLETADLAREDSVIAAFVARTSAEHADAPKMETNVQAFRTALARIRADRAVAWERYRRANDNVSILIETAAGLRRLGIESMRLDDEMRRYVGSLVEARRRAVAADATPAAPTVAPAPTAAPPSASPPTAAAPANAPPGAE